MHKLYRYLTTWGKTAVRSIAFLPIPMMFAGLVIGIILFYLETNTGFSDRAANSFPALVVNNQATARSILGLFIGGLITLVVFTFTQLMALFNQVANSYGPRLLPLFTKDRSLQFTMGFYLAIIVMTLIILLSIRSDDDGYIPNISVLFAIICGVASLVIFVYFVTKVSRNIQVDAIIERLYREGIQMLEHERDREGFAKQALPADLNDWYIIPSPIDGFIGSVDYLTLSRLADKYNSRFYLSTAKGEYVPKFLPLLRSERRLSEAEVSEVLDAVSPINRKFEDWYLPQIQLLVEIALKAMSPGINDPGTAVDVIDRLTGLVGRLMNVPMYNFFQTPDGGEVWIRKRGFTWIINDLMQQFRTYCRGDVRVVRRLLRMLFHLYAQSGISLHAKRCLAGEIKELLADARRHIEGRKDRNAIAGDVYRYRRQVRDFLQSEQYLTDPHSRERGIRL